MLFYSSCKVMFAIVLWQMAAIAIPTYITCTNNKKNRKLKGKTVFIQSPK